MYIKKIELIDIQSHANTVLHLPEKGVIILRGDNSAGKSALFKPLIKVVRGLLLQERHRKSQVRRGCQFGEMRLTRSDETVLTIHIDLQSSGTYVELKNEKVGLNIRRHITTDRNTQELVQLFGIHIDKEDKISLNIQGATDQLLMVETSGKLNGKMIQTAITDQDAERALQNTIETRKSLKQTKKDIDMLLTQAQITYQAIQVVDEEAYEKKAARLIAYSKVIRLLDVKSIEPLKRVPNVDDMIKFTIPAIKQLKRLPDLTNIDKLAVPKVNQIRRHLFTADELSEFTLPNIQRWTDSFNQLAERYDEMRAKRCFYCGRSFIDA